MLIMDEPSQGLSAVIHNLVSTPNSRGTPTQISRWHALQIFNPRGFARHSALVVDRLATFLVQIILSDYLRMK